MRGVTPGQDWDLNASLERISHWLPTQGPIKDFIHHNTLHAFQDLPFHQALENAATVYGANAYLPLAWYRSRYHTGEITESALLRAAAELGIRSAEYSTWKNALLNHPPTRGKPLGLAKTGLRAAREVQCGVDLDSLVQPTLFRLLASYLDQGISIWRMPHAHDSFWLCVRQLVAESLLPLPPLSHAPCRALLAGSCDEALQTCLEQLVGEPSLFETYLLETALTHPGWSGMVAELERKPAALLSPRPIRLREMLAVELLCELGWLLKHSGGDLSSVRRSVSETGETPRVNKQPLGETAVSDRLGQAWQCALEWTSYESLFALLESPREKQASTHAPPASTQVFFCIDDRECSTRRHLETVAPEIETFSTAGFFGVDFLFQPLASSYAFQFCPVVLTPKHVVREIADEQPKLPRPSMGDRLHLSPSSNTLFRGWMLTQTVGVLSLFRMALNILLPSSKLLAEETLTRTKVATRFQLLREGENRTASGHFVGYSFDEMADRVHGVLQSAGAGHRMGQLVVFVAHGASSANNPHFAAYDCGACSGKSGAPNARAFAWMANQPEVRARLKSRGTHLGDATYVLGALHDTTSDRMTYFDLDSLPESHKELFAEFSRKIESALGRNALERCKHFELAPKGLTEASARTHVTNRARSIFEPRPELNHARNAVCIIGRRELTRGLFLDRRSFLNSYDPSRDPQGTILEGILGAVIPVCGGINLEYYFSRVDNDVYGAGSKLPHNVVALLGVANGIEGDLLTGLPSQMVEVHDPLRLLIVIEQEPDLVLEVIQRRSGLYEWVKNAWVRLACFSPLQQQCFFFTNENFQPVGELPPVSANSPFRTAPEGKKHA